jgi:hypothetical protein
VLLVIFERYRTSIPKGAGANSVIAVSARANP